MKPNIILLLSIFVVTGTLRAQVPDWVTTHPTSSDAYIGIGMAKTSEKDYIQTATTNALADILRQINVKVESSSFLHTVDVDGKSRELFEEKIRDSQGAWLEGQELKDSYRSVSNYYVYYSLEKKKYEQTAALRRQRAITQGMDYLEKGQAAEAETNLPQAVKLYAKGLEAVESCLFYDLTTQQNNRTINVPAELYNAYINVFSGMNITTNVTNLEGEIFQPVANIIAGCLSKNGTTIPNVPLKAEFSVGSGSITPSVLTDYDGTAEFHITGITSKEQIQEIRLSIDESFVTGLPQSYRDLLGTSNWPEAKIILTLKSAPLTAYLFQTDDNDMPECSRQIARILSNNYFTVTEDADTANCYVELSTVIDLGGIVIGGLTDLNECFCTLSLKIYNNLTQVLLMNYSTPQVKVLSPVNHTSEQTTAMCTREMMKLVNRDLPTEIKKLNINQ